MSQFLNAPILVLKEGTDTSQGRGQITSNIKACDAIAEAVRSTLGPRGMDKLIIQGGKSIISNDGATILERLDIVHPTGKILVDIAKSQDAEVGDGTTSVTVIAASLLNEALKLIEEGMHSQILIKGFRLAELLCIKRIKEVSVKIGVEQTEERRNLLVRCAETALNSKLVAPYKHELGEMVVAAVEKLEDELDKTLIGVKKVSGGSLGESFVVDGVAFKKTFSYAGFEQQPKKFSNPKILLLNLELELKAEKENAEIRIQNIEDYQSFVDAEWNIIYQKIDAIVESGAQIILSRLPIGDLATQKFADKDLFCAGRVNQEDLMRVAKATGAQIQTTVNGLTPKVLGTCGEFEEVQLGAERYNLFKYCEQTRSATIVLRGGADQFLEEAERSLNDAIMIVRRAIRSYAVVGGGGAIQMELSRYLREHLKTISGKQQLVVNAFAKALQIIPRSLADNSGLDGTDILNQLRKIHATKGEAGTWYGVDVLGQNIGDTYLKFVWEPEQVKLNVIASAAEAACMVLSIDQTVRNPKSEQDQADGRRAAQAIQGGGMPRMGR